MMIERADVLLIHVSHAKWSGGLEAMLNGRE